MLAKTRFDCLILHDEIDAATSHDVRTSKMPVARIGEVIAATDGAAYERNEIRARALVARGRISAAFGGRHDDDFDEALEIYRRLGDRNAAAQIRVSRLRAEGDLSEGVNRVLAPYSPDIQVRAYDLYVAQYGKPVLSASVNRERDETDPRWISAIRAARRASALESGVFGQ